MTKTTIATPQAFALANGWDFCCIEATAAKGVSPVDVEALAETSVTADELLTWCREQVAAAQTNSDTLYRSDTGDSVTAEDLGISDEEYERLCKESDASGTAEGHVRTSTGIRVYAST